MTTDKIEPVACDHEWFDSSTSANYDGQCVKCGAFCSRSKPVDSEPRLVSYDPDMQTCTLNFEGEEYYFDRVGSTKLFLDAVDDALAKLEGSE